MNSAIPIHIYGKTYFIKQSPGNLNLQELADYVDKKMSGLGEMKSVSSTLDLAVLTCLNIAQELFELKKEIEAERKTVQEKAERVVQYLADELKTIEK